ncbi:MAG: polysaccharide biosynthesis/export family protein [Bacteroidetes bacterium]|nr:polysaccharide biosynthesis/export family protein [Bacteroidota bacterium]
MKRLFLVLVVAVFILPSCRILRPNLMLKTSKNYVFDKLNDSMSTEEYRISVTDAVTIRVLSNEGFKMVDFSNTMGTSGLSANSLIETLVEHDGTIKVPLIGRVKVLGLTMREAEQILETKFSEFYVGPYVIVRIINKRVSVFPGAGGTGKVVPITNLNTTVFEALAYAGGITDDGKAYRVKLVRHASPKPKVYLMDLSTVDGLAAGNTVVQANDIIYVEPRPKFVSRAIAELAPYFSILSTVILIITYVRVFK